MEISLSLSISFGQRLKHSVKIRVTTEISLSLWIGFRQRIEQFDSKKIEKWQNYKIQIKPNQDVPDQEQNQPLSKQNIQKEQKKQSQDKKIEYFQYGYFNIPMYKFPIPSIAIIFLPLWTLAIINLGIFYQDSNLAERISSIANIMIAFVAFIPSIREQIPPSSKIILVELLIYGLATTSLFALIHSLQIRNTENFTMQWKQNGLYIASCAITGLSMIIIAVLMGIHYFHWQLKYKTAHTEASSFSCAGWRNTKCDQYFKKYAKGKSLKIWEHRDKEEWEYRGKKIIGLPQTNTKNEKIESVYYIVL